MSLAPRARARVFSVAPYVGGESALAGMNRVIKLSSNEGAFGPPPAAIAAIAAQAATIHRYPDGGMVLLREAIGRRFGLDPAWIVCGNGSDEILGLLIQAYGGPGTELIMSAHGFSIYEIAGRLAGGAVVKVADRRLTADVDAILAAVSPATRLVCLANPNNPTGTMLPAAAMHRLRAALPPDVLLVIDAAYADYVENDDGGAALVAAGGNTVMTRTFSKIYGLGGARLGWGYAQPAVVDVLQRLRGPFNVSATAASAGIAALADDDWVPMSRRHNTRARNAMAAALQAAGLKTHPSEANFLLVDFLSPGAAQAADASLRRRGIIVRNVASYGLPHCLRVTIGTDEECDLVTEALIDFARG